MRSRDTGEPSLCASKALVANCRASCVGRQKQDTYQRRTNDDESDFENDQDRCQEAKRKSNQGPNNQAHPEERDSREANRQGIETSQQEAKPDQAAIQILGKSKEPMNCIAMVEAIQVQGLRSTPGGATPEATLYASILREINGRGKDARFKKFDRGMFALAARK